MEKEYLKLYNTHATYEEELDTLDLPNVSYCKDTNDVHYNPYYQPIIAKFDIVDTTQPVIISGNPDALSKVFVDDVEIEIVKENLDINTYDNSTYTINNVLSYLFDTTGEHVIKYLTKNPVKVEDYLFKNCFDLKYIKFPTSFINLGKNALLNCINMETCIFTSRKQEDFGDSGSFTISVVAGPLDAIFGEWSTKATNLVFYSNNLIPALSSIDALYATRGGKLYVLDALISRYKSDSNWSTISSKIKPLSEFSEDN